MLWLDLTQHINFSTEWESVRTERILSVISYGEFGGTGIKLNITTEKKKAKKERIATAIGIHGQVAIERTVNEVWVRYEYCLHAV